MIRPQTGHPGRGSCHMLADAGRTLLGALPTPRFDFRPPGCERINLYSFKPPGLWYLLAQPRETHPNSKLTYINCSRSRQHERAVTRAVSGS